jgi:hypothetical protein
MVNNINMLQNLEKYFQLPISTIHKSYSIDENIRSDLELTEKDNNLYNVLFQPSNQYAEGTIQQWNKYYTDDISFLKDSKNLIQKYKPKHESYMLDSYIDLKNNAHFCEKFHYIEWERFKFLNNYSPVNSFFSIYRLFNPFCSLLLPIIMLLITYFFLRMQGMPIALWDYLKFSYNIFMRTNSLSRLFSNEEISIKNKLYMLMSIGFYILNIYTNINITIQFHKNLHKIHDFMNDMKVYLHKTINSMEDLLLQTRNLKTYQYFNDALDKHRNTLLSLKERVDDIPKYKWNFIELFNLGKVMTLYYEIYNSAEYENSLMYSFGFNGYIDNLNGLYKNIKNKNINYANFSRKKETRFTDLYHPSLLAQGNKPIKNTCDLKKEIIITGPNASGKTTILKSTMFNILITQQLGLGFYKRGTINPYKYLHCYLNIPDTSGRDSLFQAEARRCKDIINSIKGNKERHFCIFDELYSGTNPYEATASAYGFLKYLTKYKNSHFMLTTHLIDLCKKLESNTKIQNMYMNVEEDGDDFIYTYIFEKGISTIKGGVKVLIDLDYPKEIVDMAKDYLKNDI